MKVDVVCSRNHTMAYSAICLQEMNIAYHYPIIFWNTACLTVNAGADEDNEDNKTTQYGKIAKAIGSIQQQGQKVALPDINRAKFGFIPDLETNEIIFGLKSICGIGDTVAKAIIEYQPYDCLEDFVAKMEEYKKADKNNKFGETNVITLIKAGCFDKLENKPRNEIMSYYIASIANTVNTLKMDNIETLKNLNLLSIEQLENEYRIYKFREYVFQKEFFHSCTGKSITTSWYYIEPVYALPFFYNEFETYMNEEKDYCITNNGDLIVKRGSFDRVYEKKMEDFKQSVLKSPKMLQAVNDYKLQEKWNEKASGNISQWEMDSLSFYYTKHELENVSKEQYLIEDFNDLSESPKIIDYYIRKDKSIPRCQLYRICGTVLDKDKNKHIISLLTTTGVVTVKFYKGQFSFYDRQISEINTDGKKQVIEKSWFTRGNKLLITGIRRGEQFVPKKYADSVYKHTVQLILEVKESGELELQSERSGGNND